MLEQLLVSEHRVSTTDALVKSCNAVGAPAGTCAPGHGTHAQDTQDVYNLTYEGIGYAGLCVAASIGLRLVVVRALPEDYYDCLMHFHVNL
jgi:hypothetical protein